MYDAYNKAGGAVNAPAPAGWDGARSPSRRAGYRGVTRCSAFYGFAGRLGARKGGLAFSCAEAVSSRSWVAAMEP